MVSGLIGNSSLPLTITALPEEPSLTALKNFLALIMDIILINSSSNEGNAASFKIMLVCPVVNYYQSNSPADPSGINPDIQENVKKAILNGLSRASVIQPGDWTLPMLDRSDGT